MHYRHKDVPKQFSDPKPQRVEKEPKTGLKRSGIKNKTATLIEKLDRVFSQWIRKSSSNGFNLVKCYTCPKTLHWKKMHNGHYKDRDHMGTRWHEKNCHCQCPTCNIELKGNLEVYKSALIRDYGIGIIHELDILSKGVTKFSKPDLEDMIFDYKEKLAGLK